MHVRSFAAFLILLLPVQAWAFRGRPVSDLRFEGTMLAHPFSRAAAAASDGTDFLVVSWKYLSLEPNGLFVQKVGAGGPSGPQRHIGGGDPRGVAWTGSGYLAAWQNQKDLWVTAVSRDGTPSIPAEPVVSGFRCYFAAGPAGAMAFGWTGTILTVQPLDLAGRKSGAAISYNLPSRADDMAVGPAAGGFAVVFTGVRASHIILLRIDGTLVHSGVYFDNSDLPPHHSTQAMVSTDGSDTLIVYGIQAGAALAEMRTVVLTAAGAVKSRHVVRSGGGPYSQWLEGIVWDGAQYIVLADDTPGLMRITRSGERSGDIVPLPYENPHALASNGRQLLIAVPDLRSVIVDASTLQAGAVFTLGRTLSEQSALTIAAGPGGYLAAWMETDDGHATVRASRIDAAGNYLDGEGLILGDASPAVVAGPLNGIVIDGSGPTWLVIWYGELVHATSISPAGEVGETLELGPGLGAGILHDGPHYLVARSDWEGTLHLDRVMRDGTVVDTRTLATGEWRYESLGAVYVRNAEPSLIRLDGRIIVLFAKVTIDCRNGGSMPMPCWSEADLLALPLDQPTAAPVRFGDRARGTMSVATDGHRALVLASRTKDTLGTILTAGNLGGTPFLLPTNAQPAAAFDGADFRALWRTRETLGTARITSSGTVMDLTTFQQPDVTRSVALAAGTSLPPLAGIVQRHPSYDDVARGSLLFLSDLGHHPAPPPAPSIVCAARNADGTISVRWQPVLRAEGVSVELQLPDGTYQQIGVAAGAATGVRVSTAGLPGSQVRVRAWNEGGLSAPSATAPGVIQPEASVRSSLKTCAGVPVTIGFTLSGTAPFTVRWSDGLVQTNLKSTATRTVTLSRTTTLTIVSVADAGCAVSYTPRSVRIVVDAGVKITEQPREVRVSRGQSATLTIAASEATSFTWFEGAAGDTSRPIGTDSSSLTTPALFERARYWVRVSNRCGSTDSQTIEVTVAGKSRAAGR